MPTLVGDEDKARCFRVNGRVDNLPNISSIVSLQSVSHTGNDASQLPSSRDNFTKGAKNDSANYKNNYIERSINGFIKHDTRTVTSLELTGSSVPFKLPAINLPKNDKVSNGNTEKQDYLLNLNRRTDRSLAKPLNHLSDMVEILSQPNEQETAIYDNVSDDAINNNRHINPEHNMLPNYSNVPTLPDIFHKVNMSNSNLVRASIKSKNTVDISNDASRLSFKREPGLDSISRKDLKLVGRRSTLCHRTEGNVLQKSRTYVYPVLLPISVHTDPGSFARKQSKKQ